MRRTAAFALPLALLAPTTSALAQSQRACVPASWRADASSTRVQLARVSPSERSVTYCVAHDGSSTERRCFVRSYVTGSVRPVAYELAGPEPDQAPRPYVTVRAGQMVACGFDDSGCRVVTLGRPAVYASMSDDARRAVAASPDEGNLVVQWIALPSLTRGASFRVPVQSPDASRVELVHDRVVLFDCVGAGPGCAGSILGDDGSRLGSIGGSEGGMNVYASSPVALDGARFAIADSSGSAIAVHDARTGALVRRVNAPTADTPEGGARLLHANGALVLVYGGARAGEVDVYDARSLARRGRFTTPACAP